MNLIPKLVVAFGLYLLTQSFWMTLGIMILLVVGIEVVEYLVEQRKA